MGKPGKVIAWLKNPEVFLEDKNNLKELKENILGGDINKKFKFVSQFCQERNDALLFLDRLIIFYHDLLLIKIGHQDYAANNYDVNLSKDYKIDKIGENLKSIILAKELVSKNANLKLILENLVLNL